MTATNVSIELYLRSSYEPDAEYVDGRIEERAGGKREHALWQKAILLWFWQHEKEWKIEVLQELRVQVAATRFRIPDVAVLDREHPVEQIVTHPPLAVFEILSPEDAFQRLKQRLADYHAMGIPEIWVIDPQDSAAYRYEDQQLSRRETFHLGQKGITFAMAALQELLS